MRNGEREREKEIFFNHWGQVASQLLDHPKTQLKVPSMLFDSVLVCRLGSTMIL
jgi:hypothetical protein